MAIEYFIGLVILCSLDPQSWLKYKHYFHFQQPFPEHLPALCCLTVSTLCCLVHTRSCTYSSNWASTKFTTALDDSSSSRSETFHAANFSDNSFSSLPLRSLKCSFPCSEHSEELFTTSKQRTAQICLQKPTQTGDCVQMKAMHQEHKVEFLQMK